MYRSDGPVVLIALKAHRIRTVMSCNGTLYVVYCVLAWDYLPASVCYFECWRDRQNSLICKVS